MIPLFKVYMSKTVKPAVIDTLYSGYIGENDRNKEFEQALSKVIGNDNVATTNCCTSALMISLRLAGVGHYDCILTSPMTCLATNAPILALGARPIWVDVGKDGNMDVMDLASKLRNHPVKAILCVHWGGVPCEMFEINRLARQYGIPVIEDAAQALGAKDIGNYSNYVCFSFQAIKQVTSIDGGAIAFKSKSECDRAKLMRWYGFDRTLGSEMRCTQDPAEFGYKMHMNDVNAVIGLENLKKLSLINHDAKDNARYYSEHLASIDARRIKVPAYRDDSVYWLYSLLVEDAELFILYMKRNGIACSQVHGRNDTKAIFKESKTSLPGVDYFSQRVVCIPCGWWVSKKDREYIVKTILNY